jgi:hypothetical protein
MVAALACSLVGVAPAVAAPQAPETSKPDQPMIFFVAKGEPNACGPGCSEWIAAEGPIDVDAPKRLRDVLSSLAERKLPIFFDSLGGIGGAGIEIGRLLRERKMTAGVSRTVEGELHSVARCSSACVYALIGAAARHVPPGARIGVHTSKITRSDFDGRYRAMSNAYIARYLKEMGITDALLDVISAVPYESQYYLSRDEIAEFGIDASAFQETRWTAMPWLWTGMDWQPQRFSVVKLVVEASGENRKQYRAAAIRLSCAGPERVALRYFSKPASKDMAAARSIELSVEGGRLSFPRAASMAKIEPLETGWLEARYTSAPLAFLEAAATRDRIDIVESDPFEPTTPPRILKLSTDGLSEALERLKKACDTRQLPAANSLASPRAR